MSTQQALFIESFPEKFDFSKSPHLVIKERPLPSSPGSQDVVIEVKCVALNPADAMLPRAPYAMLKTFAPCPEEEVPIVLGTDLAGIITAVGDGVTSLKVGDRIMAYGRMGENDAAAFQQHIKLPADHVVKIPPSMSFEEASSIPLVLVTAAHAMYFVQDLNAPRAGQPNEQAGQPIVIFGGSTSVGQLAIQLAKLSEYSPIIVTASSTHAEYLRSLGATHVLRREASAQDYVEAAGKPIQFVFDTVGPGTNNLATAAELIASPGRISTVFPQYQPVEAPGKEIRWETVAKHDKTAVIMRDVRDWLGSGIVGNRVEVLEGGLECIEAGLNRHLTKQVSGVKLVVPL